MGNRSPVAILLIFIYQKIFVCEVMNANSYRPQNRLHQFRISQMAILYLFISILFYLFIHLKVPMEIN